MLVPDIEVDPHVFPVLLHSNELPQALAVVDEAHDVTHLVPVVTLPGLDLLALCSLCVCSVLLCKSLLASSLLSLLSFLFIREEFCLTLLTCFSSAFVCCLALEFLSFELLGVAAHLL